MKIFQIVSAVTATLTEIDYMFDNKNYVQYTYKHFLFSKCIENVPYKPDKSNMAAKVQSKIGITAFFPLRLTHNAETIDDESKLFFVILS